MDILVCLTLDHIHNNGGEERRNGLYGGERMYRRLAREGYPEGFQVLCYNCNIAKWRLGVCPHQRKLEVVA